MTMGGQQELATVVPQARPTVRGFRVTLEANVDAELRIAPPDADVLEPWRVAVMGDIQTALGEVDEVFATINQDPSLRMVLSTGDIVENGRISEYDQFAEQLETLDIPYYSTIGNHELIGDIAIWLERFGRFNVHFTFKGATFSLVDSGSATIDPLVYDWLDGWLEDAKSRTHVFLTHFPPIDPVGLRAGSFRSRKEASKLLRRLADGNVDLTLYGHIHSYYEFDNAGIPAFVSGERRRATRALRQYWPTFPRSRRHPRWHYQRHPNRRGLAACLVSTDSCTSSADPTGARFSTWPWIWATPTNRTCAAISSGSWASRFPPIWAALNQSIEATHIRIPTRIVIGAARLSAKPRVRDGDAGSLGAFHEIHLDSSLFIAALPLPAVHQALRPRDFAKATAHDSLTVCPARREANFAPRPGIDFDGRHRAHDRPG